MGVAGTSRNALPAWPNARRGSSVKGYAAAAMLCDGRAGRCLRDRTHTFLPLAAWLGTEYSRRVRQLTVVENRVGQNKAGQGAVIGRSY